MADDKTPLRAYQIPELLDYDTTAGLLGISRRTLHRMVKQKVLNVIYVSPQRPRFKLEDVFEFRLTGIRR